MQDVDRPFTCHFCPARFTRKEHKTRHEQAHRPRREYDCQYCQRSFRRKDVLVRHERLLHTANSQSISSSSYSGTSAVSGRGSGALTAPQPGQQRNFNKQPNRTRTPFGNRGLEHPIDSGGDQGCTSPDGAFLSLDLLPTAPGVFDIAGLLLDSGVSDCPESNQELFSLPYPKPLPDIDLSVGLPTISWQEQSGLDLDAFGLVAPPSDHGGQESTSLSSSPPLSPLAMSNSRLVEKLVWLTGRQLRPVPIFELDGDWMQTSQGSIIRACLIKSPLALSKYAFQRWIQSYFLLFHPHVALLHTATFRVSDCHHVLLLCMAAIGAIYSYNRDHAIRLYDAASDSLANHHSEMSAVQRMQATLLLAIFDSWSNRPEMHIRCSAVRQNLMNALSCPSQHTHSSLYEDWHRWVEVEGFKRAVWFSYWFLSLMNMSASIAAQTPWYQDCTIELPYEESLWICDDSSQWSVLRRSTPRPPIFVDAYRALMCENPMPTTVGVFGLATLMCALFAHVQRTASVAAGSLSDMAVPLLHSCETAMNKWLTALRATVEDQRTGGTDNVAMAEAATAMWNVTMVHLHADVRVVEISQSIVSSQRDEHDSRLVEAVPRSLRMSGAMHHALDFLRGPVSHGVTFLSQTGCLSLNPCLSRLGIHCIILLAYWLHALETTISTESRAILTQDELEATDTIREVLRDSDVAVLDNAGLLLSESCLRVWSEAMSREKLVWAFDEQKRYLLRPEVLFSKP